MRRELLVSEITDNSVDCGGMLFVSLVDGSA